MSLKTKETTEKVTEQVSIEDLEFTTEVADLDAEIEEKPVYYTISGKIQQYEPTWEKYSINDLDIGDEFEGMPEVDIFEKEDKSYNAARLRLMDDGEILDVYFNFPKKSYPVVRNLKDIRKSEKDEFDFYLNAYDVCFSVLKWIDPNNIVDKKTGDEINKIPSINIETLLKIVDGMDRVGVKIIEGSPYNDYLSWMIYKME